MSVGKLLNEVSEYWPTDRATKERGLYEKTCAKYVSVQAKQTRLIRLLLYGFWFIFISVFSAVFVFRWSLQMTSSDDLVRLQMTWFRFMFTIVSHSFALLIDQLLSRKTTLQCFRTRYCFNFSIKTYLILLFFI